MGILIEEHWVNRTANYSSGDSGVYETRFDNTGELYKFLQKEYGRCSGKVYIDKDDREGIAVGWVFEKIAKYEDTHEPFKLETWVTLHEKQPITRREIFPMEIK